MHTEPLDWQHPPRGSKGGLCRGVAPNKKCRQKSFQSVQQTRVSNASDFKFNLIKLESRQGFLLFFQISFFFLRFAYSQRSFWQCHFVMVLRTKSIGSNGSGAFGNQWSIAWISLWDDCQLSWWNNTISSSSGSLVHYQISRVECRC